MVMIIEQYPQYMYAKTMTAATRDENGVFIPGTAEWTYIGRCRFESNGKGQEITTDDSKTVMFSGIVYSQTSGNVPNNTQIIVSWNEMTPNTITDSMVRNWASSSNIAIVGINLKTDKTQLHTKYYIN